MARLRASRDRRARERAARPTGSALSEADLNRMADILAELLDSDEQVVQAVWAGLHGWITERQPSVFEMVKVCADAAMLPQPLPGAQATQAARLRRCQSHSH